MDNPTKILTVYYKHKPGGFCKRLKMKINAYLEKGWQVHYVAVEPYPYQHPNLIPHILPIPVRNHDSLIFWLLFFLLAPGYIAWTGWKEKINLISVFSLTYASLCAPVKWITKAPLLTFIRTMKIKKAFTFGRSQIIFTIERLMEKAGATVSDSLVANCQSIISELEKLGYTKKPVQLLYNNISEPQEDKTKYKNRVLKEFGLPEDAFLIVSTGLLIPRKNQPCLIKALSEVESSKAVLILVGDGPLLDSLQALAKQLGSKVIFTGWRKDVHAILSGCDLFVFSSYLEGLSNSILEAMECGLPCYVSDTPENREIITHPEQIFPADQPEILTGMINEALHSRQKLEKIRTSTIEDRKRFIFNWEEKVIEKAEELIKNHQARNRFT